jgi:hypothetical protein
MLKTDQLSLPPVRDYVPYAPGPFKVAMHLNPLDVVDWIEIDERLPAELAEKRRLLAGNHAAVFAALPEAQPGAEETLRLLAEHLPARFPAVFQRAGSSLINRATGEVWDLSGYGLHPLELAARLVQEDLCLMGRNPATGQYRLIGACVCFPSRWRIAEKIGRPINDIHGPVPHYAKNLAAGMDRLFERMKPAKSVWRVNWGVVDDPALFQPVTLPPPAPITPANAGERLWLRMERQTLRRLPTSGDVLFTIRIYNHPLAVLAHQPERAARLAAALRGLDEPMRDYKSIGPYLETAVAWLEQAAN